MRDSDLDALGKHSQEISEILRISDRTVEFHAFNACHKLGVVTQAQAVAIALREWIIGPPSLLELLSFRRGCRHGFFNWHVCGE
jgi:Bacterial regulatory proteins, luxR family